MLTKASIAAIKDELEDTKGPGTIKFDVSLAASIIRLLTYQCGSHPVGKYSKKNVQ